MASIEKPATPPSARTASAAARIAACVSGLRRAPIERRPAVSAAPPSGAFAAAAVGDGLPRPPRIAFASLADFVAMVTFLRRRAPGLVTDVIFIGRATQYELRKKIRTGPLRNGSFRLCNGT